MLGHFLWSVFVAAIVYAVGTAFDKSPNNKVAGIAGLVTFVFVFLGFAYVG